MNASQIVLGLMTIGALAYTILAYPNKYGALSGRSRLYRTVGVCLLDLLLMLVLMATFIDFHAGVAPTIAPIRFGFYVASCFFLCFSLVCVAALDGLESYSSVRHERRDEIERVVRDEIEKARAERIKHDRQNTKGTPMMIAERVAAQPDEDARYMRRALYLARLGRTHPNPMVGAVLVKNGQIVGEGYHRGVGTPHAETAAFADAGKAARGATIYVTLEPCSFHIASNGEPRIPCSHRCLAADISRAVGAMEDPDPRVSGEGYRQLRNAGISVTVGVAEDYARTLNEAYVRHRQTGLPYITHKAAMTLDGKIAAASGDSRWVTGPEARAYVHRLRDRTDAVIVGIGTILADDPELTSRIDGAGNVHDPQRVVIDSSLRLPVTAKVARVGTLVIGAEGAAAEDRQRALEDAAVEVVVLPAAADGRVDVGAAARLLADRGLLDCLLESGGALASSFWDAGLIDKALFFVAPKVVGGESAGTPIDGVGVGKMAEARILGKFSVRRFGQDVVLETRVNR